MYRLTRLTLDHPRAAWLVLIGITVLLGSGLPKLRVEHGSRVLIGADHPIIQTLDSVVSRFGGGLPIRIGWSCGPEQPCADALDPASIALAHELTQWLESHSDVRNVLSPSNASLLLASEQGFRVRRLVENDAIAEDLSVLAETAAHDELWAGRLVSADRDAAAIIVQPFDNDTTMSEALIDEIELEVAKHREAGFDIRMEGIAARAVVSGRDLNDSTARLIPLLVLLMGGVLLILFRSISQTIVSLASMGLALLWTRGTMGLLGWPQDGIHQVLAPLILIVGVCDAVHLLSRAQEKSGSVVDRILEAVDDVGPPCLVTTATTALALASFTTSGMFSFVRFGAISAIGVTYCLFLTFTILPLVAAQLPGFSLGEPREAGKPRRWLEAFVRISQQHARRTQQVALALLLLGVTSWALWLRVDTDWVQAFGEDSRISQWMQFFDREFGGAGTLEVELGLPDGEVFEDPEHLRVVASLGEALSAVPGMGRATSILLPLSRLNAVLHDGDQDFYAPSKSRAGNAELLELMSFDDPESLVSWLSADRRFARLSIEGGMKSHAESRAQVREFGEAVDRWVPAPWSVRLTGLLAMDEAWTTEVQSTQLRSFPTAFLLVFLLASYFLGSVRLGLLALIPTFVPIIVVLGTMGLMGLGLDIGRAMVAAVVIGIGVDDAIHFIHEFKRRVADGETPEVAARGTIRGTGRAIAITSVSVAVGFLALIGSAWQTISSFGFFVAITVVAALFATLFLLPGLLTTPFARRALPLAD